MKLRTKLLIGLIGAAMIGGGVTKASALMTWWGPEPGVTLAPVGERTLATSDPAISPEKMEQIRQAIASAPPAPVGEGENTNMYLHIWPVGAVGMPHLILVPVSGTRTHTETVARTHARVEPVGERATVKHVIVHHNVHHIVHHYEY